MRFLQRAACTRSVLNILYSFYHLPGVSVWVWFNAAADTEAQHSESWTAPVQPDVNGDLLIPAGCGQGALMHLHPAILPLHIRFVPLNYNYTITDLYNSPDAQWLSLPCFFKPIPFLPISPLLFPFVLPPFASLSSGIPGVLSLTAAFVRPVLCWHGWCVLLCDDGIFRNDSN